MFVTDEIANNLKAQLELCLFVLHRLITVAQIKLCTTEAVPNTVNLLYKYCILQEMAQYTNFYYIEAEGDRIGWKKK